MHPSFRFNAVALALGLASACSLEAPGASHAHDGDVPAFAAEGAALAAQLRPDPARPGVWRLPVIPVLPGADRVGLRFDADGPVALEARAADTRAGLEGGSSAWRPGVIPFREGPLGTGHVDLPPGARFVELALRIDAAAALTFVAVETFAVSQEGGRGPPTDIGPADETDRPQVAIGDHGRDGAGVPRTGVDAASPGLGRQRSALAADGVAISRADWGSRQTQCSSSHRPDMMTVHHTVSPNDGGDMAARVRQIQAYHMDSRGYCDVGYHFLVGQDGEVYQGRLENLLGAHAGGGNTNNAGVSYIGTFTDSPVPDAMMQGGARILRSIADFYGIALNRDRVKGHREVGTTATECPGQVLFDRLEELIALAASGGEPPPPPPGGQAPIGRLERASCDAIVGWAQDPDAPEASIDVHLYFDGPAGSGAFGLPTTAGQSRDDLCAALGSCAHAFSVAAPAQFRDGQVHRVYAYAIDPVGGTNPLLTGAPASFSCQPGPVAAPFSPDEAVKRPVVSPEILALWGRPGTQLFELSETDAAAFPLGAPIDEGPRLVQAEGDPRVFLANAGNRRHVPNPEAMAAWDFDFAELQTVPPAELGALLEGFPIAQTPFFFRDAAGTVFLLERNPPLTARVEELTAPAELEAGETGTATLVLRNAGALTWPGSDVRVGTEQPRDGDSALCDPAAWLDCRRPAALPTTVAPGETVAVSFPLRAPADAAGRTLSLCTSLVWEGVRWFSDVDQGGPAPGALCFEVRVVEGAGGAGGAGGGGGRLGEPDGSSQASTLAESEDGCGCSSRGGGVESVSLVLVLALLRARRRG